MEIDHLVIIMGFGEFAVFWLLHVLLFPKIHRRHIITWFLYIYVTTFIIGTGILTSILNLIHAPTISNHLALLTITIILVGSIFSLLCIIYIIGIFGVIESSVRMKLLTLVAEKSTRGLTQAELAKTYNKVVDLTSRLNRLISSGDVQLINGKYYLRKQLSLSLLLIQLSQLITWIYAGRKQ